MENVTHAAEAMNGANEGQSERDAFAKLVMEKASAMKDFSGASFISEDNSLEVISSAGKFRVNLASLRHECQRVGSANESFVIEQWLLNGYNIINLRFHEFDQVQDKLVPIIRSRMFIEGCAQKAIDEPHVRPLSEMLPYGGDAVVLIGIDLGTTVTHVSAEMFSQWGKTFDECIDFAMANIKSNSPHRFDMAVPGVYRGSWCDGFESSRLMLPNLIPKASALKNAVMMVPIESELLVARANDERGLLNMVRLAESMIFKAHRPVSSRMYRYVNGALVEFTPAFKSVEKVMTALNKQWDHEMYSAKSMQPSIPQYIDFDEGYVHLSEHRLFTGPHSNAIQSMCVFPYGFPCVFPKVDYFTLSIAEKNDDGGFTCHQVIVKWKDLYALMGGEWKAMDCYPPRYKSLRFPKAEELEKLTQYTVEEL